MGKVECGDGVLPAGQVLIFLYRSKFPATLSLSVLLIILKMVWYFQSDWGGGRHIPDRTNSMFRNADSIAQVFRDSRVPCGIPWWQWCPHGAEAHRVTGGTGPGGWSHWIWTMKGPWLILKLMGTGGVLSTCFKPGDEEKGIWISIPPQWLEICF